MFCKRMKISKLGFLSSSKLQEIREDSFKTSQIIFIYALKANFHRQNTRYEIISIVPLILYIHIVYQLFPYTLI